MGSVVIVRVSPNNTWLQEEATKTMNTDSQGLTRLLNADEVKEATGISIRHLWRLVATGEFPAGIQLGRCRRWHPEEVEDFLIRKSRRADRSKGQT